MPKRERKLRVSDYFSTCSTRERARRFYPVLLEHLESARRWEQFTLSFENVEFVSPSFLDDTLIRLAQDRPEIARRVVISGLSPYVARRLEAMLDRSSVSWSLQQRDRKGEYRLAT